MYRLIACDIDDTILDHNGKLPKSNRDALRRLHERGIAVVLSSGRATISVRRVADLIYERTDDTYLLTFNGARVVTAASDDTIYEQFLEPHTVRGIVEFARKKNVVLLGYDSAEFIYEAHNGQFRDQTAGYARSTSMNSRQVVDLATALPNGSPKLLMIDEHETLETYKLELADIARGEFVVTFSKPHYLEILHPKVNKGIGLQHLANHLRLPIEETLAVGDNLNDIEMLTAAGLGIAVGNAHAELKKAADVVLERSAGAGAIEEVEQRFFS